MVRTLHKERFLPSLLDRLTDDDPIKNSIQSENHRIKRLEKELTTLLNQQRTLDVDVFQEQRQAIQLQLDQAHAQYSVLSASVSSLKDIRACVKRDLDWLLNANQYEYQHELEPYPEVEKSVLNFGLPDLTGRTVSGVDMRSMEQLLKESITAFEPRIIKKTLKVNVVINQKKFDYNAVVFEIEGLLWAEPEPLHLHLRTEFELEGGEVSVFDFHKDMRK
ncbi:MAG: type VI secretion system baseplate subunit TssE [Gammaproteobacteria bacterium]